MPSALQWHWKGTALKGCVIFSDRALRRSALSPTRLPDFMELPDPVTESSRPSGATTSSHSTHRPTHSTESIRPPPHDTAGRGQLPLRGDFPLDNSVASGIHDEDMENNAQSPAADNMCHSVQFQYSSTHGNIPLPAASAEADPAVETVPNSGDDGIGRRPGTGGAALRNPLPGTRFGLKKGEQLESMQRRKSLSERVRSHLCPDLIIFSPNGLQAKVCRGPAI
jgi:hypothetical protein